MVNLMRFVGAIKRPLSFGLAAVCYHLLAQLLVAFARWEWDWFYLSDIGLELRLVYIFFLLVFCFLWDAGND